jgi:probable F420-dependent oxidoreductase
MLELSASHAVGAQTYCVPTSHTERARGILGPDPLLVVGQAVAVSPSAEVARQTARAYVSGCLRLENYARSLLRMGYSEEDVNPERPSEHLLRDLVAWTPTEIADRCRQHLQAGASQVCVQVLDERAVTDPRHVWAAASSILADCALD